LADEDIKNSEQEPEEGEMTFLEHLEELRWRLIKAILGIVVGSIICAFFVDWLMNQFLLAPALRTTPPMILINLRPYGQMILYMKVVLSCGFILSIPYTLYQFWKFFEPGLLPKERKYVSLAVFYSSFCFLSGIAFAYMVMLPTALGFFVNFGTTAIANNISVEEYFSFIISIMIAAGLVFELPVLSYLLSKMGILKPSFMRKYRRHAIVIILLVAGIVTPSPDVTSQLLLGIPFLLLYELSIFISKMAQPKPDKED
jgi:sec-independent protein translocase protein TatC